VVKTRQDFDLTDSLLLPLKIKELVSIILLYGDFLPCLFKSALSHLSIGSLSNLLSEVVILYFRAHRRREFVVREKVLIAHVVKIVVLAAVFLLEDVHRMGSFYNFVSNVERRTSFGDSR